MSDGFFEEKCSIFCELSKKRVLSAKLCLFGLLLFDDLGAGATPSGRRKRVAIRSICNGHACVKTSALSFLQGNRLTSDV